MKVMPLPESEKPLVLRWQESFRLLAYRNKAAETSLYLLLLSGLPLWSVLAADWSLQRWSLALHISLALILFPALVVPFWLSHRRLLQRSNKVFLRRTGQLLEILLLTCGLSGFYLMFIGNRGDGLGYSLHLLHLSSSLLLAPILLRHAWRWSVLRFGRR